MENAERENDTAEKMPGDIPIMSKTTDESDNIRNTSELVAESEILDLQIERDTLLKLIYEKFYLQPEDEEGLTEVLE